MCRADCFDMAARVNHVNPRILRAIAMRESNDNPHAIRKNRNGSRDYGIMQVNSIHLPMLNKMGIHRKDLMNVCKNINVAAMLLRRKMDVHGNTWTAVGAYHSETPGLREQYARMIRTEVYYQMANR
jgi:soluble lytic murein transglycosylase-like protein